MEQKKTPRASLENRKSIFFLMGLVVALSSVFTAFEWGTRDLKFNDIQTQSVVVEEEDIEITPPDENTPPPPPPPEAPAVADVINVVDDKIKLDNVEIMSVDDTAKPQQVAFAPQVQERREEPTDNQVFDFIEEMPEYPGGQTAMMKFLTSKINYPAIAAENNIQGRVTVRFIVEKDGSVTDVKVVKGIDSSLDKEAVRVVKLMPKWKPGKQTGKPVRCRFTIPVVFRLRN